MEKDKSYQRYYINYILEVMIIYAQIVRTNDGLPLSANTDFNDVLNQSIKDSKKYVKMLAYKSPQLPEKCSLYLGNVSIYLTSCLGISYVVMTEPHYPPALAYSFLKELMIEFAQRYSQLRVDQARRPYEFIEFDNVIHKTRLAFNKPQNLMSRLNLADVETELRLRPPRQLSLADIEPVRNGYRPKPALHLGVGPPPKLQPISPFAWVAMLLSSLLILLGFYRGISALQVSTLEEYDGPSPILGLVYLLESFFRLYQLYLLTYNSKYRIVESWASAVVLLLCIFFLWELRDPSQHAVFVVSTLLTLAATHFRELQPILPDYHV